MHHLRAHWRLASGVVGLVLTIIGLGGLPDDLSWWERAARDAGDVMGASPVAAAALIVGLLIIVWVSWPWIQPRLSGGRARWRSDAKLINTVTQWLLAQGYGVTREQSQARPNMLVATLGDTITSIVKDTSMVTIASRRVVTAELQDSLATLPTGARHAITYDLAIELAQFGVLYEGLNDPLQQVTVYEEISIDQLDEDRFNAAHTKVRRADILISAVFQKSFGASIQASAGPNPPLGDGTPAVPLSGGP